MLDPNSAIVGIWDSGDSHKTLNCKDSVDSDREIAPVSLLNNGGSVLVLHLFRVVRPEYATT